VAAANLADRYISDRHLPDKAIDLIDEAGSRLRIKRMQAPPDLREIERKLNEVQEAKKRAVEEQQFEEAGRLRDQEKALLEEKAAKEVEVTLSISSSCLRLFSSTSVTNTSTRSAEAPGYGVNTSTLRLSMRGSSKRGRFCRAESPATNSKAINSVNK
jgi:ATP-dependent Clp protease ATP-binding subunit ClpA